MPKTMDELRRSIEICEHGSQERKCIVCESLAQDVEIETLEARVAEIDADKSKGLDMIRDRLDADPTTVAEAVEGLIKLYKMEFDERDAAEARVAELRSGLHEIAASLPVHESKDLDADNIDDVCRAVKLALGRYADKVEHVEARVAELEAADFVGPCLALLDDHPGAKIRIASDSQDGIRLDIKLGVRSVLYMSDRSRPTGLVESLRSSIARLVPDQRGAGESC